MRIILTENIRMLEVIRNIESSLDASVEFVVPKDSSFAQNDVNVNYMRFAAQQLGKQVKILNEVEASTQPELSQTDGKAQTDVSTPVPESTATSTQQPIATPTSQTEVLTQQGETGEKGKKTKVKNKKKGLTFSPKKIVMVLFVFVLLTVVGAAFFVLYYLPRGTVTLYVAQKVIDRSDTIEVSESIKEATPEGNLIPGRRIHVEMQDEEKVTATGTKTVGDEAQGIVDVKNFTESDLQLGVGTQIVAFGVGGETFAYTLDSAITVPRVTVSNPDPETRVMEAGVQQVDVTAVDIGESYNLSANRKMQVGDFDIDEVFATNPQPFTGGSTREVTVVSSDDQSQAQDGAVASLKEGLLEKLNESKQEGEIFDEKDISYATQFVTFGKEIGDEASEFLVSMGMTADVIVFSEDDVKSVLQQTLADNLPNGFELSDENEVVKVLESNVVDGTLNVKASVTTLVVPILNLNEIKSQLVGKRPAQVEGYLKSIDHLEGYDINLWPALPDVIRSMPHLADRLSVSVEILDK
ncbi:hypothetical protein KC614_00890 [candidate division WWE3 bacterium]|uniref:Baseplate protein J-like domain-containing protein n=1 Tax=candidate division WWE3 bacterium TaxID=2053526 RepID=A0A955LKW9_UNCKA|nr:hypothetical protein [candidate division WWE3 bacterium]